MSGQLFLPLQSQLSSSQLSRRVLDCEAEHSEPAMEAQPFVSSTKTLPFRSASPSSLLFHRRHRLNCRPSRNFTVRASSAGDSGNLSLSLSHNLLPFLIIFNLFEYYSVVTLLDYGAGNVRSVRNAIRRLGFDVKDVIFSPYLSLLLFLYLNTDNCFQAPAQIFSSLHC